MAAPGRPAAAAVKLPQEIESAELPADAIEIGRIADAWGIKGWFKVLPHSADPQALFSSKRWFLLPTERGLATFSGAVLLRVREAKEHSDSVVARADGIEDRAAAEMLKGARVFVPRSSFPTASIDEYYWVDLLGLDVVNREGLMLGRVKDLMATGPNSVLVLEQEEGAEPVERMIPFVAAYVDTVDLQARRITVDWQPDY
ncbi:ribosome maturation factor RimM [Caenimonas sedimenti]|uniref:Ribosome maturation factor RimM n=1 Tax=Caenimonas sedimenti TaxID=2596921 RepID=A0A562ZWZ1_9BURK|nr:ribosome maturation factor RimM [Caenimonas sedimenti]TWO73140.1 ribosome maturation factor RimM [Caenimonas sedimenti]